MSISTRFRARPLRLAMAIGATLALAQAASAAAVIIEPTPHSTTTPQRTLTKMAENYSPTTKTTAMKTAQTVTTKVLAIGTWTAKATPETRPPIMPSEARDTMLLMLSGKIDQWYAKHDGSGAVFLMNVTDPAEAHTLLEALPLGQADMMRFELIPIGPLWPLGLLLPDAAK